MGKSYQKLRLTLFSGIESSGNDSVIAGGYAADTEEVLAGSMGRSDTTNKIRTK
jgi:hypothetical protein